MDPTMRQVIKDVVRLRKVAGVTQQEVSALAGEPCRTFLAHLEQGRKTHLNLRKLYGVLHVLFSKTKGEKMSQDYVTKAMLDQALATLRAEILASKTSSSVPKAPRVVLPKPAKPQFEQYVDEIVRASTIERPAYTQEILHKLKKKADARELYSGNRRIKIQEGAYVNGITKLRGAAIEQYLQVNGKVFTGLNTPDKFPEVKFIRIDPAVNAPNPFFQWPATPAVTEAVQLPLTNLAEVHHLPQPRNQLLEGLTQEETDYAVVTFGHGIKNDAGWLYIGHPLLVEALTKIGSTSKESIHRCTHRDIEAAEAKFPDRRTATKQGHEVVGAYLLWLSGLGLIHVEKRGNDLFVSRQSNSRLTPEPLAHLLPKK